MVRLIAPNGTPAQVGEELAKRLVVAGFKRVDATPEPEPFNESEPLPEAKPVESKTGEAEPVKRGPGRPRKTEQ